MVWICRDKGVAMNKLWEELKDRYRNAVSRAYMSHIRGDILKEFLLAIFLHNVPGTGEILESDGSVKKVNYPMDDAEFRGILDYIVDNEHYLFIWSPARKNDTTPGEKFGSSAITTEKTNIFAEEDPGETIVTQAPPEVPPERTLPAEKKTRVASSLEAVKEILDNTVREFQLMAIIFSDKEGNPLVRSFSPTIHLECKDSHGDITIRLVRLVAQARSDFIQKAYEEAKEFLKNKSIENSAFILSFDAHVVRVRGIDNDHLLILVIEKNQIGLSNIVENKLVREIKDILSPEK